MRRATDILRWSAASLTLVVGAIHIQQYLDFIKAVPTINNLFLLNGLGAGVICVLLAIRPRTLAALAGIGLSAGALASITVARYASGGLFSYQEPTLRAPVVIAVLAEIAAVGALAGYLAVSRHTPKTTREKAVQGVGTTAPR